MPASDDVRALIERYATAFSSGDQDTLRAVFSPDAQIQGVLGFGGLDVAMPVWHDLHAAFGAALRVDDLVVEDRGDHAVAAARYTETGTFTRPFRGAEPTGKSYSLTAMEFFLVRAGRIERRWGARDSASLWKQLGVVR